MAPKTEERSGAAPRRGAAHLSLRTTRTRGAQLGNANALKHGRYTRTAIRARRHLREILREARGMRATLRREEYAVNSERLT